MPCASSRSSVTARRSSAWASSRCAELRIRVGPDLRPQEAQCERKPDEALLRAVVEVALEPAALGVTRFDDAGARGEILQLSSGFGLQALVLERETRRRGDLLDEPGCRRGSARWRTSATGRPSRTSGVAARPSRGAGSTGRPRVGVAALPDRVRELEVRIGERLGEPSRRPPMGADSPSSTTSRAKDERVRRLRSSPQATAAASAARAAAWPSHSLRSSARTDEPRSSWSQTLRRRGRDRRSRRGRPA